MRRKFAPTCWHCIVPLMPLPRDRLYVTGQDSSLEDSWRSRRWRWPRSAALVIFYFDRAPKPSNEDPTGGAEFQNNTGDAAFGEPLRQSLLDAVGTAAVRTDFGWRRPAGSGLHASIRGRSPSLPPLPARSASAPRAPLSWRLRSILWESRYVLGLRAKKCGTDEVLFAEQVQVERKEDVADALSRIAGRFRACAANRRTNSGRRSPPLLEATTFSLEALRAYSAGRQPFRRRVRVRLWTCFGARFPWIRNLRSRILSRA